jgi:hypothetical protein
MNTWAEGLHDIQVAQTQCRPTTKFSDRPLNYQHAGAQRSCALLARPPAAEHFMRPGSLQRRVRRHVGRTLFFRNTRRGHSPPSLDSLESRQLAPTLRRAVRCNGNARRPPSKKESEMLSRTLDLLLKGTHSMFQSFHLDRSEKYDATKEHRCDGVHDVCHVVLHFLRCRVKTCFLLADMEYSRNAVPPNYQVQRPTADPSARGRAALVCAIGSAARGRALYVSRFAATPS